MQFAEDYAQFLRGLPARVLGRVHNFARKRAMRAPTRFCDCCKKNGAGCPGNAVRTLCKANTFADGRGVIGLRAFWLRRAIARIA